MTGIDWVRANALMQANNASYYPTAAQRAPIYVPGTKELAWCPGAHDACALFVELPSGEVALCYQGTDVTSSLAADLRGIAGIIANVNLATVDIDLRLKKYPVSRNRLAVAGYFDQWADVEPQVALGMQTYLPHVITGHSKGGCMAQMAARCSNEYTGQPIVLFASPKCFNAGVFDPKYVQPEVTSYIYNNDIFADAWPYPEVSGGIDWQLNPTLGLWIGPTRNVVNFTGKPRPGTATSFNDHVVGTYAMLFDQMANYPPAP